MKKKKSLGILPLRGKIGGKSSEYGTNATKEDAIRIRFFTSKATANGTDTHVYDRVVFEIFKGSSENGFLAGISTTKTFVRCDIARLRRHVHQSVRIDFRLNRVERIRIYVYKYIYLIYIYRGECVCVKEYKIK